MRIAIALAGEAKMATELSYLGCKLGMPSVPKLLVIINNMVHLYMGI